MSQTPLRLMALSGSLRTASTNTALLRAAQRLAEPPLRIDVYDGLSTLPLFNPDLDDAGTRVPEPVRALRDQVGSSDGLLIASPEYAHGVPGAFKNALDWLVSGPEFPGKPIALFHATTRGTHARAALAEILTTMSGIIVEDASVSLPLLGQSVEVEALVVDVERAQIIQRAMKIFSDRIRATRADPGPSHSVG